MNAVDMLKKQHRQVEKLFKRARGAKDAGQRERVFVEIADALAVHTAIEERHFYPAVKDESNAELLRRSVAEHLGVKRLISELLDLDGRDPMFVVKLAALEEHVNHHVDEEEDELFPRVEEMLDDDTLATIAAAMAASEAEIREEGQPHRVLPAATEQPADI